METKVLKQLFGGVVTGAVAWWCWPAAIPCAVFALACLLDGAACRIAESRR